MSNQAQRSYTDFTPFQITFLLFFSISIFGAFLIPFLIKEPLDFVIISIVGLISAISGVFAIVYQARAQAICLLLMIINTITYGTIAFISHAYGQTFIQWFIMVPIQLYGYIVWKSSAKSNKVSDDRIKIKKFNLTNWTYTIIGLAAGTIIYTIFLYTFPLIMKGLFNIDVARDTSPIIDSLTGMLALVAMIVTAKGYFEQWIIWISSNLIGTALFAGGLFQASHFSAGVISSDIFSLLVQLQYFIGSIYGMYLWRQLYKM
ncbi:MAG: nicotinamide riboside transporter PnuC [Psittacicella sp.]